jgi:flagellar biogenesis protein FliO
LFVCALSGILGVAGTPDATNSAGATLPALPEVGVSVLRVAGALALVFALFFGGIWLFRNWQRLALRRGPAPRLNVLESRALGNRQSLLVVGYERQRMLLAASPAGVSLVAHLPESECDTLAHPPAPLPSFAVALQQSVSAR